MPGEGAIGTVAQNVIMCTLNVIMGFYTITFRAIIGSQPTTRLRSKAEAVFQSAPRFSAKGDGI